MRDEHTHLGNRAIITFVAKSRTSRKNTLRCKTYEKSNLLNLVSIASVPNSRSLSFEHLANITSVPPNPNQVWEDLVHTTPVPIYPTPVFLNLVTNTFVSKGQIQGSDRLVHFTSGTQ